MRIPFACMLLLSATVLAQVPNDRYREFNSQHIIDQMSADRCDEVIKDRKITTIDKKCKGINTFILSTEELVKDICGNAGKRLPTAGKSVSTLPFLVIVCRLRTDVSSQPPDCLYSGKRYTSYITITCENGFPVHYG